MKNIAGIISIIFVLSIVFLFNGVNYCFADEKIYEIITATGNNGSESQNVSENKENSNRKVTCTPQASWVNNTQASSNSSQSSTTEDTVSGLTMANVSVDTKAKTMISMGASLGDAAFLLMSRQGGSHSASEVSTALVNAGYDAAAVNTYLSGSLSQSNSTLTTTQTVPGSSNTITTISTVSTSQDQSNNTTVNITGSTGSTVDKLSTTNNSNNSKSMSGNNNYTIGSGFTQSQQDAINNALGSISPDKIPAGLVINNGGNGGSANGTTVNIGNDIPDDVLGETIIHEFAHVFDKNANGEMDIMMSDLFSKSEKGQNSLDFASKVPMDQKYGCPANQTNSSEDFAYTSELYYRNSGDLLTEALDNAGKGHSVLLEKVLFVMEKLFSTDSTVTFYTDGNKGQSQKYDITKGSDGSIKSIGGVNVKNSDGSYNIAGLKNLFKV